MLIKRTTLQKNEKAANSVTCRINAIRKMYLKVLE